MKITILDGKGKVVQSVSANGFGPLKVVIEEVSCPQCLGVVMAEAEATDTTELTRSEDF